MDKIKIMISSTVKDLEGERDAIQSLFENSPMYELIGANPYSSGSWSSSSAMKTVEMAKECDLYILILGHRYGFELENGKSATEVEFDAASKQDPTKVLIFLKKTNEEIEAKQKAFIRRVSEYYSGYWRTEFSYSHQLKEYVNESVLCWMKGRASLNKQVSYCEHFIREALQLKPTNDTEVYYSVQKDYVEIEYRAMRQSHCVQYARSAIFNDFWQTIYKLRSDIDRWCLTWKI